MTAHYHLPGLFEFYDFYIEFLPLYYDHKDWFYPWCDIASIYGSPEACLWGGGRTSDGKADAKDVFSLMNTYGISSRLTFSNSLLKEEDLLDEKCNKLCRLLEKSKVPGGVIVFSKLLEDYLKNKFSSLYLVSSTTKVLTNFKDFYEEVRNPDFKYVVPDFRLNHEFEKFSQLTQDEKDKIEFLCNECCDFSCNSRKACYENVSRKNLGLSVKEHKCVSKDANGGYRFSLAMKNPSFISIKDIQEKYLPFGFSNFKIEGRGLGSAVLLEFILYYMTKPEYQLEVREALYLDSMLDLF